MIKIYYTQYGKWSIRIINEKQVLFYDNSKWKSIYCNYQVIPAGILINGAMIIMNDIPKGAVKKAEKLIKKYYEVFKMKE